MSSEYRSLTSTARGVDIHHHYLPPDYVAALRKARHPASAQAEALAWSPESSLAMMDSCGIETAILSLSLPGIAFEGAPDPAALARGCNEYAARMMSEHPGRFGAFAELPLPDVEAALGELAYALDTLRLNGVQLLSNIAGRYIGEVAFDPVLAELNRRKANVFLHPNDPPGAGYNDFVEFPHDVTRAVGSLTESGALERYPRIRYILAYGGGTIPFIAARVTVVGVDVFANVVKTMMRFLKRVRTMQRMSYDITASTDAFALMGLYKHAGAARLLMGSNYPWSPPAAFVRQKAELRAFDALGSEGCQSIERINSLKLFPRLA